MDEQPENSSENRTGTAPAGNDKALKVIILVVTRFIVACLLMVWGAMNLATNVQGLRRTGLGAELFSAQGLSTIGLIAVTGLLPVVIGILILLRFDSGLNLKSGRKESS